MVRAKNASLDPLQLHQQIKDSGQYNFCGSQTTVNFQLIYNLAPHTKKAYSPLYHLARVDILFAPPGIQLLLKWSKTAKYGLR